MRTPASDPSDDLLAQVATTPRRAGWRQQTRSYRLLTPLFGGGVQPGEADPVTIVRTASVRGQLRFWWRATRGGHYGADLKALREAEARLWGAASTDKERRQSLLEISLTVLNRGRRFIAEDRRPHKNNEEVAVGSPNSKWNYGAFPLNDKPGSFLTEGVRFSLTLRYPTVWPEDYSNHFVGTPEQEIAAALWAWETFGGVGGRTRRGFGAVWCENATGLPTLHTLPKTAAEARQQLSAQIKQHIGADQSVKLHWPDDVPHLDLDTDIRLARPQNDELTAWRNLLDLLKDFRQQRPFLRTPYPHPGRNRWPEPDEIRRLTGNFAPHFAQPIVEIRKFPRAAFGLPIIFEFKRDDRDQGDPRGKHTLTGRSQDEKVKYERLASPLIIRPIPCDGGVFGLAILLKGTHLPEQLVLAVGSGRTWPVRADLTTDEAVRIRTRDDRNKLLGQYTNVLLAFLDTVERSPQS